MPTNTESVLHHALALYGLTVVDGEFLAENSATALPFRPWEYSSFKYGRRDIAEHYGKALAGMIIDHLGPMVCGNQEIVILGTPYKRVPNAARMLAIGAQRHMRAAGLPVTYTYIYQHRLVEGDYSKLSVEQRELRNKQKKRYVDPDDFAGRHVVVIDDIRITGSIERSIIRLLGGIPVLSTSIVNLVRLDPDAAKREPQLESKLNHCAMKGLRDLLGLMSQRDQFVLTTRAVKYILESSEEDIHWLLGQLDDNQIAALYEAIVDEGYDVMQCYRSKFSLVCDAHL
ncbi:MAG TPA: phosphoribosyltransferase family protein [Candidatus Saccharimonadales bacterium]|nr:phosphoribosyltransferase family protein [Candidatus Saccharimonadales bacterium]